MFNINSDILSAVLTVLTDFYSIINKLMKYILISNFMLINQSVSMIVILVNISLNAFQNADENPNIYNNSKSDTRVLITHILFIYKESQAEDSENDVLNLA